MERTIRSGRNVFEHLNVGGTCTGFSHNIKEVDERFPVDQHVENSRGFPTKPGTARLPKSSFREVQTELIHSRSKGNVVAEVPLAAAAVKPLVSGSEDQMIGKGKGCPPLPELVSLPESSNVVYIIPFHKACENANGIHRHGGHGMERQSSIRAALDR